MVWASALAPTPRTAHAPPQRAARPQPPGLAKTLAHAALACALSLAPLAGATEETSAGFEEFAAKGGTMEARPQCFFDECGDQSKACFTNPVQEATTSIDAALRAPPPPSLSSIRLIAHSHGPACFCLMAGLPQGHHMPWKLPR